MDANARDESYQFQRFHFPDLPRTVVGVRYRAGDTRSALPLGGLGTGTVYFDSRGQFGGQSIANSYRPVDGVTPDRGFDVRVESAGHVVERPLADLARSFLGHFPIADLEAGAPDFPVAMEVRAMAPFILGDARASATPAALFRFRLHNQGHGPAAVSVRFKWRAPIQESAGGGVTASGNVDGFLCWNLGNLEPGQEVVVPVKLAAAGSMEELKERLLHPQGDLILDGNGAFNWENNRQQCLHTAAGGCLSQHGFYLHYNDNCRAGTRIIGPDPLENLARINHDENEARLKTTDGALEVSVRKHSGILEYHIRNVGSHSVHSLRLSVYANLEAGHTEGDDQGRLDPDLHALVITDASGAACAMAGEPNPDSGWCGIWGSTIPRMESGEAIAAGEWQSRMRLSARKTLHSSVAPGCSITRQDPTDHSGCTLLALHDPGVVVDSEPTGSDPEQIAVIAKTILAAGESRDLRFVLAWYYPDARDNAGQFVGHQYSHWFASSASAAKYAGVHWADLVRRTGEWQERIYTDPGVSDGIKDQVVNSLYSLARNTAWLKDGRFTHSESFVGCPITETIVCRFYGSFPTAMFFPELEKNTMRQFIHYQRADGAIPFAFGGGEKWDSPYYETQKVLDSSEFALMAWRDYTLWKDSEWAREVFPAVKKAIGFARTLDTDGDGLPNDELSSQYYDCWQFHGASAYTSGIWLAALKAAEALGKLQGDRAFQQECESLFVWAQDSFQKQLWTGNYYRLWNDPVHGTRSDTCLAAQLTGQWYSYLCGLGEILPREQVITALEHISQANGRGPVWALVNGITAEGARDATGSNGHSQTSTLGETWCYAATCIYAGHPEMGLPRAERLAENIALNQRNSWGTTWNMDPDTGEMLWGGEYYSNMCIWNLWMALGGSSPQVE